MCHIFFIHLSVDGHLGCFHVLAIVNSAAMNSGVHVSFFFLKIKNIFKKNNSQGGTNKAKSKMMIKPNYSSKYVKN